MLPYTCTCTTKGNRIHIYQRLLFMLKKYQEYFITEVACKKGATYMKHYICRFYK